MTETQWPKQTQAAMTAFFGPPGGAACTTGKVDLPFSFPLAWDTSQKLLKFSCHQLVEKPLERIYAAAAKHYGEKEFRRLRLDRFGGCYNYRAKRGSSSLSTHAWGIAVDHDPERNQLKWGRDRASFAAEAYVPFWNIVEAEGAVSLGRVRNFDWMHFQFAKL
jgi:hypothetical protein